MYFNEKPLYAQHHISWTTFQQFSRWFCADKWIDRRSEANSHVLKCFIAETPKIVDKYPLPEGDFIPWRVRLDACDYKRELTCLQQSSLIGLFYFWFSDPTCRSSNPSLPSLLLNQQQRVIQYVVTCWKRWQSLKVAVSVRVHGYTRNYDYGRWNIVFCLPSTLLLIVFVIYVLLLVSVR
jgi:hypothetical protein